MLYTINHIQAKCIIFVTVKDNSLLVQLKQMISGSHVFEALLLLVED